jgi:maleylacetoacetate isomerase
MTPLKLHSYWRSSAAYRVRIGLALKGIPYEYAAIHLMRDGGEQFGAAYRALNPQSRVPTLEVEGHVLTQSLAILEWLDERYPDSPRLLPGDAFDRARVRSLALLIAADIQPLQNTSVVRYLREQQQWPEAATAEWLKEWIDRGLAALEARLSREADTGRFCHRESPTLADVCLVPQCYASRRFGVDPEAYPRIHAIERACQALDAFRAAAPDAQPDRDS